MQRVVVLFVGQYVVVWGGGVPPRLGPLGMGMWVGARGKHGMHNPPTLANERNPGRVLWSALICARSSLSPAPA